MSTHRVLAVLVAQALLAACGSSNEEALFGNPTEPGRGPDGPSGSFSSDPVGTNAACVTDVQPASLPPVNLVIMYDKSGSMGDNKNSSFDPNLKWNPVNAGMKGFFADKYSSTLRASLQFFPQNDVTVVFGETQADATNLDQAYRRFHAENVGIDDVLIQDKNAVMLWHFHPSDADRSTLEGCLSS